MATSLDGLIRHLVDQIALCGEHGALPSDFTAHVKSYYVSPIEFSQIQDRGGAVLRPGIAFNLDRPFLEQVWKWLIKNPDIGFGSHAEHKHLTLSEAEARNVAIEQCEKPLPEPQKINGAEAVAPSLVANALTNVQDNDISQSQQATETDDANTKDAVLPKKSNFNPGFRLYASENRMWHALAGHGPDHSKIKSFDFVCLSIIAAHGPKGILQHDLVRISGQDKRSLPARTDRLRDGGYVEKKRVCVQLLNPKRLLHTSQCFLKRFVNCNSGQKQQTSDPGSPLRRKRKSHKKKAQRDQDSCVPGQSPFVAAPESVSGDAALSRSRPIPSWTADRSINNQIFELVDWAGIKGMSMTDIRDNLMGDRVRKPVDDYVSRLVDSWPMSQPPHLRHLSLVRDTALKGKTQIYIYYTYENFKKLVEAGTAFWEAVKTVPSEKATGENFAAALDAKPDLDEYGFPKIEENQFQGLHKEATLEECVLALKVDPLHISALDPVLLKQADGSYGVRYKRHQQHTVTIGSGSSLKQSAPTSSQAASKKARASEPQKSGLSISFGAASIKTLPIEPANIATPKPPRVVPAKVRAVGLEIKKGKHVRNPNSKPLGRPRKYPKTGIPLNFATMAPDEIEYLLHSQEMFEKYEIVKIEKEIVQRIEEGADAVAVAYEVLAERDKSRQQEGELPLPKTSRAQVLHHFAGEPMPEPDLIEAKSKVRQRKDTRYRPSMAANTFFVPPGQAAPEPEGEYLEKRPPLPPTRTRRRGRCVSDQKPMIYFPSVAAHSWPYFRPPPPVIEVSTLDALQNKQKHKQSRTPNQKQLSDPRLKNLPSITTRSGSSQPPDTMTIARAGQKRKRPANVILENDEESTMPLQYKYFPSIAAHSGSFLPADALHEARAGQKRKRSVQLLFQHDEHHTTPSTSLAETHEFFSVSTQGASPPTSDIQLGASNEGMYPGWKKFMAKYYQQQLETIVRLNAGVFIGKTTLRRKRPCEPRDLRPSHFKLVVFKSSRLSELDWFLNDATASEQTFHLGSRTQTPKLQVAEQALTPYLLSMSKNHPDPSRLTDLPSPASSCSASQPKSNYVSPYADGGGKNRKRTTSPQPTHDAASFDFFSASRHSKHSSPTTESSKSISVPSIAPQIAALSAAIDQDRESAITESKAPVRTQERQSGTKEATELTPNASVLQDVETKLGAIATSQVKQSSQSSTAVADKILNQQPIVKINRRGGSTAMLRKHIIMEIIDRCEGVFPSHKEMSSPFAAEWKRRGQEGTPESKTISNAVNALINESKLRQITFTSQTRQGIPVTKSMLILSGIDTTDPKVKETQANMVAFHPRYFVPSAVLPPSDHQTTHMVGNEMNGGEASEMMTEKTVQDLSTFKPAELRRVYLGKKMMNGKNRAALARLKASEAPNQQALGDADGGEPTNGPLIEGATTDAVHAAPGPGRVILPKTTTERLGGRIGQKRVERLASIRKHKPSQIATLSSMSTDPVGIPGSLIWLPSKYAFSDFNFEEQRHSMLMPAAENSLKNDILEAPIPLDSGKQARQCILAMAENAARIECKQALANSATPSLLLTSSNADQSESPHVSTRPSSLPRRGSKPRSTNSNTDGPRYHFLPYPRPKENTGRKRIGPERMRPVPPISNTMPRESLSANASPSIEAPLSHVFKEPLATHAEGLGTSYKRVLLVSFMDPIHYLHRATGTFSVNFTGLRPPRKIFAHRGTTLDPYAASLRAVQPYTSHCRSSWPPSLQVSQKSEKTTFDEEVDILLRRELEADELNDVHLVGWPFVNHLFTHAHKTVEVVETDMEAAMQVTVCLKDGRLISRPFVKNNDSRPRTGNSIFGTGDRGIDPAAAKNGTLLKRRRLTSLVELGAQDEALEQVELDQEPRRIKLRRVRGPREAKSLGENGEERLLTAVMVIRALTGGLDKRIDWVLVAKVFEPTYTQMFVHSRWSLTLQKYKLVLPKMESDFQSIFASAYEEGTVPAIDYDNLEDYDWKWLIEWTMANVDTPTQSLPELLVERPEFDDLYTLNETNNNEINEFYEIDGSSALARRTKIVHRDPHVLPLFQNREGAISKDTDDLAITKSWIRANIMTPESTYNPSFARVKLSTFPDRTVEDALKQLLLDRVLTQENKGRLIPGRNYDISDFLVSRLKKNLQAAHFHQAAAYKQQLDHDFKEKGFSDYSYAADDGDMIVIVNLQAHQRITIVPVGVPMNKWGQTDGGYETRQMDKRRLNFSLELQPSPTYIYGNPLPPLPAPPSRHLQDPMAKIPLWYDINGSLIPVMWEMALAAVLVVLAMRPGVGASELEKVMRPAMEIWELQEVLEWLVNAKAAKQVGHGFSVAEEWWWLVLGTGDCIGEWSGEDGEDRKTKAKEKGRGKRKRKGKDGAGGVAQGMTTTDLDATNENVL